MCPIDTDTRLKVEKMDAKDAKDCKPIITAEELAKHSVNTDLWVAVDGQVYDITNYVVSDHPGGKILPMQLAGRDATALFRSTHPKYCHKLLGVQPNVIHKGALMEENKMFSFESEFHDVLSERIQHYFKSENLDRKHHPYGSVDNGIKVSLMALFWVLGWYYKAGWTWVILQAFTSQLFCFSVMHTNNHGGLTNSDTSRWLWDCAADTCGGISTIAWRHLHNCGHHFYTNIPDHDTDIQNDPIFRFSEKQPRRWYHAYQHLYASPLMCLFPAAKMEFKHTYISLTLPNVDPADRIRWACAKFFYWTVFMALPVYWHGWQFALLAAYARYVICSTIYTHVIAPTHINEHCQHITDKDWFKHQVHTSSDSAPGEIFTNWFTAGLSHQIEHHLFPMIHHLHYPGIQPIVKRTCDEFKVPYVTEESLGSAVVAYWRWLKIMGSAEKKA